MRYWRIAVAGVALILLFAVCQNSRAQSPDTTMPPGWGTAAAGPGWANEEGMCVGEITSISGDTIVITSDGQPGTGGEYHTVHTLKLNETVKLERAILGRGAPAKLSDLHPGDTVQAYYVKHGGQLIATSLFDTWSPGREDQPAGAQAPGGTTSIPPVEPRPASEGVYIGEVRSVAKDRIVIVTDRLDMSGFALGAHEFALDPAVKFKTAIFGPGGPTKPSDLRPGDQVSVHYVKRGGRMVATRLFETASASSQGVDVIRTPNVGPVARAQAQAASAAAAPSPAAPLPGAPAAAPRPSSAFVSNNGSTGYGASDPALQREIRRASEFYGATKWQNLWRKAKQAHAAAQNQPPPEPSNPESRAEFDKGVHLFQTGDTKGAAESFAKCANRGDPYCQTQLGWQYETGQGVTEDWPHASRLYAAAAVGGNARAQNNLGNLYVQGKGVPRNYQEAVRWFAASASQGNADGFYSLARMYEFGFGVPMDRAKAVALYTQSALLGDLDSVEAAHWLSDPTNLSFPDQASRDAYLAGLQSAQTDWFGCESHVENVRRLGFKAADCIRRWVNPRTW